MLSVSVHIVTYNSETDITACIQSVFRQSHPVRKVIIVDNASDDATLQELTPFAGKVEIVKNNVNVGFAAAHNQAIQGSDSDCFLVLNPDVVLDKDYIKNLVMFMESRNDVGSVTGKLLRQSDGNMIDSMGLVMSRSRRAQDLYSGEPDKQFQQPFEVFGVSAAAALYRRLMVEDISINNQFFDEDFFAYKEDVDVAWRGRIAGWSAFCVPDAVAHHQRGWKSGERRSKSRNIRTHSYINRYKMIIKCDCIKFLVKDFLYIVCFEVLLFSYALLREPFVLKAWIELVNDLPCLIAKRKAIRARLKNSPNKIYHFFS